MNLNDIEAQVEGVLHHDTGVEVTGVSIDTRTLKPGDIYIAIIGEQHDGHKFIAQAIEAGAVAAIISKPCDADVPLIEVQDTTLALGRLAAHHRCAHPVPLIAITGSCGKTTTRALTQSILEEYGSVLATSGNFNNHIGAPLTLLRLADQHQYAVVELGANHHQEIAYLTGLAEPQVAVITNAGPVHLEGFGDVPGVARAKGEIFSGLSLEGVGILNADSPYYDYWLELLGERGHVSFGIDNIASVSAYDIGFDDGGYTHFVLKTPEGEAAIRLPLLGKHNVYNALAAAAAAQSLGSDLRLIKRGLEKAAPVKKRLAKCFTKERACILDDSYNANPDSLKAAIDVLCATAGDCKVLVLGDMAELGPTAAALHQEVGQYAKAAGIRLHIHTYIQ